MHLCLWSLLFQKIHSTLLPILAAQLKHVDLHLAARCTWVILMRSIRQSARATVVGHASKASSCFLHTSSPRSNLVPIKVGLERLGTSRVIGQRMPSACVIFTRPNLHPAQEYLVRQVGLGQIKLGQIGIGLISHDFSIFSKPYTFLTPGALGQKFEVLNLCLLRPGEPPELAPARLPCVKRLCLTLVDRQKPFK